MKLMKEVWKVFVQPEPSKCAMVAIASQQVSQPRSRCQPTAHTSLREVPDRSRNCASGSSPGMDIRDQACPSKCPTSAAPVSLRLHQPARKTSSGEVPQTPENCARGSFGTGPLTSDQRD